MAVLKHVRKILLPNDENEAEKSVLHTLSLDMEKVSADKSLSDFDKWLKYNAVLQSYINILKDGKKPVSIEILENSGNNENRQQQQQQQVPFENEELIQLMKKLVSTRKKPAKSKISRKRVYPTIHATPKLRSVDKTYSDQEGIDERNPHHLRLLKALEKKRMGVVRKEQINTVLNHIPELGMSDTGEVRIGDDTLLQGSNVIRLLEHLVTQSRVSPAGFKEFKSFILKSKVPKQLFVNKSYSQGGRGLKTSFSNWESY